MPDDTILCWRTKETVRNVKDWLAKGDAAAVAAFLQNRFDERYFVPINALTITQRNGFMTMAISCLVIEALEAFHQGWPSSDGKSQLAFCNFFDRWKEFHVFKGNAQAFWKNVRCGILHQAETTGGWSITLMPGTPIFDGGKLRIQADEFHAAVARSLKSYTDQIKQANTADEIWKKCTVKLKAIVNNCN